ncbi:vacuolar protein sorting-associated protein 32 homolog 2-like isoform X2 [Phoenix dactylifera]|uniref:Vacuolar protein sorting-associated protein 32 homolog 2-like isoform X2 n=1 Tax=Phoenix dactylifera TaxID=42345 RepID=A0A8B8ZNV9_PHODC|nr:vacuolar protein sorting-associated protein 32 homolog 2-like isoform X2 [Phoenix dactylifera]
MFSKLFHGCRQESPKSSSDKRKQTLEMLGKKEIILQKKISVEVERAKEFTRAKKKQAAMQCLKRKKFYEGQMEQLCSFQSHIRDQEQKLPQKLSVQCGQVQQMTSNLKENLDKA